MTRAYVAGLAPRSQTYMRRHWDHAKSFIDDDALEAARDEEEQRWQDAQREAGLDLISPSYVATEDLLRPLTELPGATAGPLTRTFETNTFHRRPVIEAVPEDGLRPWVDRVRPQASAWVLSLPSPYDALLRSDVQDEQSVVDCLADAAAYALETGADLVRFQEPSAAYRGHRPDVEAFRGLLQAVTEGDARCVVHFSQGDVLARPELLEVVPCAVGLEPGPAPEGLDLSGRQLHVGVVRGESSLVEDAEAGAALALAEQTGATLAALTNGWDLEHVPFDVAVRKLQVLAAARPLEVAT